MAGRELTPKEKTVLFHLVKYPTEGDRFIAEKSNVKLSTVTAIKNRLYRLEYIRRRRIPYFFNVGYEIFNLSTWNLVPDSDPFKDVMKDTYLSHLRYLLGHSGAKMFLMNFSRNYTDSWVAVNSINRVIQSYDNILLKDPVPIFAMPIIRSEIYSYFDYYNLIARPLGLNTDKFLSPTKPRSDTYTFSRIEKKAFNALLRSPELTDTALSGKYGMTRQNIARLKKKFESEKLLKTLREPDLKKLGFEIMELTVVPFRYNADPVTVRKVLSENLPIMTPFLAVQSDNILFYATAHMDYPDYQKRSESFMSVLSDAGIILTEPETHLISLEDIKNLAMNIDDTLESPMAE